MRADELKNKQKSDAKRKMLMLTISIGLPVLALGTWLISGPIRQHKKAQSDATALFQALNAYAAEQGELPHGSYATICQLLRGKSLDGQNTKHLDYIEAEGVEINAKGEFLDPWGHPYVINFEKRLRVFSCGPNGRFEEGQGDDIVAQ